MKKKKKLKNKKQQSEPKKEKELSFAELLLEKKQIVGLLNENEKKCYKHFIGDIQDTLASMNNEKQTEVIKKEVCNETSSFVRAYETLKRICIYGHVKDKNLVIPIDADIIQSLEGIWNKYGDEIVLNY